MAHKKGQGSSRNGRDSNPQYRGVKRHDGQLVNAGTIIVRQVGTKIHAGRNVGIGKDWTLYARETGQVRFENRKNRKYVSVFPVQAPEIASEVVSEAETAPSAK